MIETSKIYSSMNPLPESELSAESRKTDLVIVAAGKGSRLGYHLPKLLYPFLGQTILDAILSSFQGSFHRLILIVSVQGESPIREHLEKYYPGLNFRLVIQIEPKGMANAVFTAIPHLQNLNTMIVWGDQASIKRSTVLKVLSVLKNHAQENELFVLPSHIVQQPYIHFIRNSDLQILQVLQKREGDSMPAEGETDCGFFGFRTSLLKKLSQYNSIGRLTQEQNFLPLLAVGNTMATAVTLRILEEVELMGINTSQDAEKIEREIRSKGHQNE